MAATAKQLANLKPAKKGEVRNPKGRNGHTTPEAIRELARKSSPSAIRKLVKLIKSKDERIAVTAATKIIEIGLGGEAESGEKGKGVTINIMPAPEKPAKPEPRTINAAPVSTGLNGNHATAQLDAPRVSVRPLGVPAERGH